MDDNVRELKKHDDGYTHYMTERDFPIVGIGTSAGGLEAFAAFINIPPKTSMAFVLIQHLDPGHASSMVELLKKYTGMPVLKLTNTLRIEPKYGLL